MFIVLIGLFGVILGVVLACLGSRLARYKAAVEFVAGMLLVCGIAAIGSQFHLPYR